MKKDRYVERFNFLLEKGFIDWFKKEGGLTVALLLRGGKSDNVESFAKFCFMQGSIETFKIIESIK